MTQLEHHLANIGWAKRWLATPADQLPGKLTHAKAEAELEHNEDALHDFVATDGVTTFLYDTESGKRHPIPWMNRGAT